MHNKVHFHCHSKGKMLKYIRMGITVLKFSFGEVYHRIYVGKSHLTAPLTCRRKSKFLTV